MSDPNAVAQQLDLGALVKAEMPQPAGVAFFERGPVDHLDSTTAAQGKLVQREREARGRLMERHCCD